MKIKVNFVILSLIWYILFFQLLKYQYIFFELNLILIKDRLNKKVERNK
jgi:hypothetical protein